MQIFVIDVAAGDDIPRKGGPGIARADLLAINKTDLAPYVGSDVERMVREASERRGELPVAAISLRSDVTPVADWVRARLRGVPRPRPPALVDGRRPRSPPRPRPLPALRSTRVSRTGRCGAASGSRRGCSGPGAVTLLRSQAGPLAGDHDRVEIVVESGTLAIEPIAATVALPGPRRTLLELDVTVGDGAHLELEDAPLVVAEGADVVRTTTIRLGDGASATVRDLVVLGRAGEGPGRLESLLRIEGPDGVILHDALRIEPGADDAYVALAARPSRRRHARGHQRHPRELRRPRGPARGRIPAPRERAQRRRRGGPARKARLSLSCA